jgi:hypothetical protein
MTMSTDVAANITAVNTLMDRRVGSVKYTQIPCNVGAKGPYWANTSLFGILPSLTAIAAASITPS